MMITRRFMLRAVGGGIAIAAASVEAQKSARLPRIGVLTSGVAGTGVEKILSQGLRELGYVEDRTAVIEWRSWGGKTGQLRDAAAEMVRLSLDVIVVGGSEATKAMKEATGSIPIVFLGPSYPVEEGLIESFARPGGNVTGVTLSQSDHVAKQLQLLREAVPTLVDVGVIWSPANLGSTLSLRDTDTAARGLKLKVLPMAMESGADVEPALAEIARSRPGALIVHSVPIPSANVERISALSIRLRIPSLTPAKALLERGLLMSYGADVRDIARRIPSYVDRILKGAKPADMPVEQPTKFELVVNMKTARALGLTIPHSLLVRADEVIE